MLFSKKGFRVVPVRELAASAVPWRRPAALVLVRGGRGALRWAPCASEGEHERRALLLGDTPLLLAESDNYWCPTCEKLLALGLGRDRVDPAALESLRAVSNCIDAPLATAIQNAAPLLQLLGDGLYVLSFVPHYPTNGQGDPFWDLGGELRPLDASRDLFFTELGLFRVAPGYPAFLLPTQRFDRCDWDAVEAYRQRIRKGEPIGGLAFWNEGFLSALLDGHHRATAALLEGKPLECLTVMADFAVEIRDGKQSIRLWDERIPFDSLPKEAVRVVEEKLHHKRGIADRVSFPSSATREPAPAGPRWDELVEAARRLPEVSGVGALEIVGDTSDARLQSLLGEGGDSHVAEIWLVLQALIASHDPRAVELALRVGRGPWTDLWEDAFRFLATQRAPEVEAFFVDFLVRDEGRHSWLEKFANEYLAKG